MPARFQNQPNVEFFDEPLLVQDSQSYALGPHTDSPLKVISSACGRLAVAPRHLHLRPQGPAVHLPRGGPHYPFDRCDRMLTMPYVPNALLDFLKTPNAFHGVEPVNDAGVPRNLLLYDVRIRRPGAGAGEDDARRGRRSSSSSRAHCPRPGFPG